MVNELKSMVGTDETIMYEGKPNKKCFIFDTVYAVSYDACVDISCRCDFCI